MEYFEQLCTRIDATEPTGTQDSGPNARNPKIPPAWHRQLVEWMLNVRTIFVMQKLRVGLMYRRVEHVACSGLLVLFQRVHHKCNAGFRNSTQKVHLQLTFQQFPRDAEVQNSTIAVAVVFMQKYLTEKKIGKEWLQLLAMVCTFVASKVNESHSRKSITMVCPLIYLGPPLYLPSVRISLKIVCG